MSTEANKALVRQVFEEWAEWDQLGLLQQIGAIPAPAPVAG